MTDFLVRQKRTLNILSDQVFDLFDGFVIDFG